MASAGASLTPSPTIATTRPSSCRRRTSSTLPSGKTSETTRSMPTCGSDRCCRGGVVAGEQDRLEPEAAQLGDGLGAGRLDGVADGDEAADLAVPGDDRDGGAATLAWSMARARSVGDRQAPLRHPRGPADHDRVTVHDADDTASTVAGEPLDRGQLTDDLARMGRDCPGDRVLGGVLNGPGDARAARPGRCRAWPRRRSLTCGRWSPCRSCRGRSVSTLRVDSRTSGPRMTMPS